MKKNQSNIKKLSDYIMNFAFLYSSFLCFTTAIEKWDTQIFLAIIIFVWFLKKYFVTFWEGIQFMPFSLSLFKRHSRSPRKTPAHIGVHIVQKSSCQSNVFVNVKSICEFPQMPLWETFCHIKRRNLIYALLFVSF